MREREREREKERERGERKIEREIIYPLLYCHFYRQREIQLPQQREALDPDKAHVKYVYRNSMEKMIVTK